MKLGQDFRVCALGLEDGTGNQDLSCGIGMNTVCSQGVSRVFLLHGFRQGGHRSMQIQITDSPLGGFCFQLLHVFQNPAFKGPFSAAVFGEVQGAVLVANRRGEQQDITAFQAVFLQPSDQSIHICYVVFCGYSQNGFIGAQHDHRFVKPVKGGILIINIQYIADFITPCADIPEFYLSVREKT